MTEQQKVCPHTHVVITLFHERATGYEFHNGHLVARTEDTEGVLLEKIAGHCKECGLDLAYEDSGFAPGWMQSQRMRIVQMVFPL